MSDATARLVFTSGTIYSTEFPFSTALIVDDGKIAWIGDQRGLAGQLLESDVHVDCDRALLTPAFFDAAMTTVDGVQSGIAAGLITTSDGRRLVARNQARAFEELSRAPIPRTPLYSVGPSPLSDVEITDLLTQRTFAIANSGSNPDSLRRLTTAGVPFAYGSGGHDEDIWQWIREMVFASPTGLSARAAFNAATRSGWRLAGEQGSGTLALGGPARLCLWRCDDLEVQIPDDRVSAWSTDVRAGIPPLPDVHPSATLPKLTGTMIDNSFQWLS